MDEDWLEFFESRQTLEEAAKETSQNAPPDYQQSTYLYFIARVLVAIYEAQFGAIPIQVWNEYRNALDHFYRHLTGTETQQLEGGHIRQMEGHVQRAALDVAKIICHDSQETFADLLKREKLKCLRVIDAGRFYTELTERKRLSERRFITAKVMDSNLGEDAKQNQNVLGRYLNACYSWLDLIEFFESRRSDMDTLAAELKAPGLMGHVKVHLTAHAVSKLIWAGVVVVAFYLGKHWPDAHHYMHILGSYIPAGE